MSRGGLTRSRGRGAGGAGGSGRGSAGASSVTSWTGSTGGRAIATVIHCWPSTRPATSPAWSTHDRAIVIPCDRSDSFTSTFPR